MDKFLEIVKKVAVALLLLLLISVFIMAVVAAIVIVWPVKWWLAVASLIVCGIAAPVIWGLVSSLWPYLK